MNQEKSEIKPHVQAIIDQVKLPDPKKGFKTNLKQLVKVYQKRETLLLESLNNAMPMGEFNRFLSTLLQVAREEFGEDAPAKILKRLDEMAEKITQGETEPEKTADPE